MSLDGDKRNSAKYTGKNILAPMVRVGTLPMRLLALDYGADLVYCEELIDFKFLRSVRKVNDALGTIDYVDKSDGTIVFRTCKRETDKVILQLGTADPGRALKVAKLVENDIAGIDINMGCPKEFSIKGGMGAALMANPDKACAILRNLVENLSIPVTCKIRVFSNEEKTLELCKRLASTGISAIAVHGRTRDERPQHANRNKSIHTLAESLSIPLIANGGSNQIEEYRDIEQFRKDTGASSVMVARAAQANCSVFRREGKLPLDDVITSYLKYAVIYDNAPANAKYCVQNMLKELQETPRGQRFLKTQTLEQICEIWGLGEFCREHQRTLRELGLQGRREVDPHVFEPRIKRKKIADDDLIEMSCAFLRSVFPVDTELPKTKLLLWARRQKFQQPKYTTFQEDKLFQSIVDVDGKKYSSNYWEKNKRWAEQGAALVCLVTLGVFDRDSFIKNGSIL